MWRDLDWVCDDEKVYLDCSPHPNLMRCLSAVFDSQIAGGKRYDLAAEGRRLANATFSASHACDTYSALNYAMDLTPLMDQSVDIADYIAAYIDRFKAQVNFAYTFFPLMFWRNSCLNCVGFFIILPRNYTVLCES